jgi:hypothetical protein
MVGRAAAVLPLLFSAAALFAAPAGWGWLGG